MRILVIGGTLFVGRLLVRELQARGHTVVILHRRRGGQSTQEIVADRNNPAAMQEALRGERFDFVFDNVYDWERGTSPEQVEGTVRACGVDLQGYVFLSSVAAYGSGLDRVESDPLAPEDHPDPYVRNKANSERALFRLHRQEDLPVTTFRPPFIYGPGNPYYREAFFWDRLRDGRPILIPDDGQRLMQFVYVGDVVQACLRTLDVNARGQAFNLGTAPVTQEEVVRTLAEVAGVTPQLVYVPRKKMLAAGGHVMNPPFYFGEYYDLPPITMYTEKVRRQLGWQPIHFAEGLHAAYERYLTQSRRAVDYEWEDCVLATRG